MTDAHNVIYTTLRDGENMGEEDSLYQQAMKCIDDLVDEVIQRCYDVAEQNHFEREWVLEQFRNSFNKAKRNNK